MKSKFNNILHSELIKILAISFPLFLIFYGLFAGFYNQIHFANPSIDLKTILWWHQNEISNDGVELYFMTFLGFLYIIASLLLFKKLPAKSKFYVPLFFISAAISLFILFQTRTGVFGLAQGKAFLITWLAVILGICWLIYFLTKKCWNLTAVVLISLTVFGFISLVSLDIPSFYDWGFYLGPALKLMQEESLRSFFFQYDLSGVLLFWLMMLAKLQIYQMQVVLWGVLVGWLYLYYLLAKKLIKSPSLILLFMLALMIVRFFAIGFGDPINTPSVLPLRLDLWAPLLLLLLRFGFSSVFVAVAFSAGLLLNHVFGLLYLALYLLFLIIQVFIKQIKISRFLQLFAIPIVFLIIYYAIFGSFLSVGEKLYQSLQITFIPIALNSLFWPIWAFLPIEVWLLTGNRENKADLLINLFILGLLNLQLVYFYGRSHDHNLLNLSGIWLFVAFLSFSKIPTRFNKSVFILASVLVLFLALFSSKEAGKKMLRVGEKLSHGKIIEIPSLEQNIDRMPDRLKNIQKDKTLLVDDIDSFLNYKLGLQQRGYYAPFFNNVYVSQTSQFLLGQINQDVVVEAIDPQLIQQTITQLNNDVFMQSRHLQFILNPVGGLYQIRVLDAQKNPTQIQPENPGSYIFNGISFAYPPSLKITKVDNNSLLFEDKSKTFSLRMSVVTPKPADLSGYLATQKGTGKLGKQGVAEIFNFSVFIQEWQNKGVSESHFFLVKNNSLIQIIFNPANSQAADLFNNILKTIQ